MAIKGFLIDLEGTLVEGNNVIAGTHELINFIKNKKYKIKIVSNTTNNTSLDISKRLEKSGINIDSNDIYTALDAIKDYLLKQGFYNSFLLTSEKTREVLKDFFNKPYNCVVITHARENFNYENINTAFRLIMEGAIFISSSLTRYFKDKDEKLSLDAGAFTYALMYATGREPIILGKPSKEFFLSALRALNIRKDEVIMIGDDIENDIKPCIELGIKTALVKTGKFQEEDLKKGIVPDYTLNSIKDLVNLEFAQNSE